MTHVTHDPMAITSFRPTHGTRRGRGMVVLDNPLGLESKKVDYKKFFRLWPIYNYSSRIVFSTYLLNLIQLEIAPFDSPIPKTPQ